MLLLTKLKNLLLDLIYPKSCLGCGKARVFLCQLCLENIPQIENQNCYLCHRPSINGLTHPKCATKYSLDSLLVFSHYSNMLRKAIKTLKYRSVSELGVILGNQLGQTFAAQIPRCDSITFVPISVETQRKRGFNQSEMLAKQISTAVNTPVETLLRKIKLTKNQAELTFSERKSNLKGVYQALGNVKGKNVVLVDDVCTTGTTLNECCRELKKVGVGKVYGLVLARGK